MKSKNTSKFKIIFYSILMLLTICYIAYRIFFTLPTTLGIVSLFTALLVLFIEIWESCDFFIYFFNILTKKRQFPQLPQMPNSDFPDIDILIATYNEEESLLKNTIQACLDMDYPDKNKLHIYLCDDGNRKNIKLLAREMNINYITRSKNNNAKAGNYNHALQRISSPYVATFDADMAPMPNFLLETLPYFLENKEKIGFVQTPQSFVNPDIFQYRLHLENKIPFEQDYFYHDLQISKNATNSVVYCGTNTLFLRQALLDANGFATGTISEDIATGMLIEEKGYKCIAINKVLAYGKNTNNLTDFIKQRSRWARGCVQILKKYSILTKKGLSLRQKLEYLSCISYWFFGLKRMIYLIAPLLFSIFGIIIVDCNLLVFLAFWLPTYLLKRFLLDKLEGNKRSSTWNKIYETILSPILCFEVLKELFGFKKTNFEVTPKNSYTSNKKMSRLNLKLLISHIVLLLLNICGYVFCLMNITANNYYIYILSFVWILSNIFYLTIAIIFDCSIR